MQESQLLTNRDLNYIVLLPDVSEFQINSVINNYFTVFGTREWGALGYEKIITCQSKWANVHL